MVSNGSQNYVEHGDNLIAKHCYDMLFRVAMKRQDTNEVVLKRQAILFKCLLKRVAVSFDNVKISKNGIVETNKTVTLHEHQQS